MTGTNITKRLAEDFGSTENKLRWALIGSVALILSNIIFFAEGLGPRFVSMAVPGAILVTPFAYDFLAEMLGKTK